jgi:hypothetical protein
MSNFSTRFRRSQLIRHNERPPSLIQVIRSAVTDDLDQQAIRCITEYEINTAGQPKSSLPSMKSDLTNLVASCKVKHIRACHGFDV